MAQIPGNDPTAISLSAGDSFLEDLTNGEIQRIVNGINESLSCATKSGQALFIVTRDAPSESQTSLATAHDESGQVIIPRVRIEDIFKDGAEWVDLMPPIRSCMWRGLCSAGEKLRPFGMTMETYVRNILARGRDQWSDDDLMLIRLVISAADYKASMKIIYESLVYRMTSYQDDEARLLVPLYKCRMLSSVLMMRPDVMGDWEAMDREAKASGLIEDICSALEGYEEALGALKLELESLASLDQSDTQREFWERFERGEFEKNEWGIYQMTDGAEYRNVGPDICLEDIATPASSADDIEGKRCPFCLEEFKCPEHVVQTICKHYTHSKCLSRWVNSMAETCNTCVSCRHELFERRPREVDPFFEKWQSSTFNLFQEAIFVKLLEVSGAIRVLNQLRTTLLLDADGDADGDADNDADADADEDDGETDFSEGHADPRATVALFD